MREFDVGIVFCSGVYYCNYYAFMHFISVCFRLRCVIARTQPAMR